MSRFSEGRVRRAARNLAAVGTVTYEKLGDVLDCTGTEINTYLKRRIGLRQEVQAIMRTSGNVDVRSLVSAAERQEERIRRTKILRAEALSKARMVIIERPVRKPTPKHLQKMRTCAEHAALRKLLEATHQSNLGVAHVAPSESRFAMRTDWAM